MVDALVYMLERWEKLDDIDVSQLMNFVQGPDFPTGGVIVQQKGEEGLEAAYGSGRGRVSVQAKVHIEEMDRGRSRLIVTELPYMTNKSSLIERIASLARESDIEGITDLRDESDRQGMRIVIELTKNVDPEKVLAALYKRTPMQSTFSIIMLALVDNEPRMLSLKQALRVYIEHRLTVIKRRAEHDLDRAKQRAHILEGYLVALKNLDEIIKLIRAAADVETARVKLMKRFKLTEMQANAILEMQLRRLAALERKKIETEHKEMVALIKELETLLKSPKKMRQAAADELLRVKAAYGDHRRTQIVHLEKGNSAKLLSARELLPDQTVWVGVTAEGLVSRGRDEKMPRPSGNEAPRWQVKASTTDTLYLVSESGKAAAVAVHTLPETEKLGDGTALAQDFAAARGRQAGRGLYAAFPEIHAARRNVRLHRDAWRHGQKVPGERTARSFRPAVYAGQSQRWRCAGMGATHRWHPGNPAGSLQRVCHSFQGGGCPSHGAGGRRRERDQAGGRR